MRVLCQIRPDFLDVPGADTTQLLSTKPYLERLGLEVDISTDFEATVCEYDLVHLFGTLPAAPTYVNLKNAKSWRRPVVLSPFYWNPLEYIASLEEPDKSRNLSAWWEVTNPLRREVISDADLVAPAARVEARLIEQDFGLTPPTHFVPVGIDRTFQHGDAGLFAQKYGRKDFVLCVGRIEPHKNQLSLIQALRGSGLPLVFVGAPANEEYFAECQRAAGQQAVFFGPLAPLELANAYAAAKVHALPSWYDTPGQVNLAAGLAGCNVVTTDRGSTREYLGDYAYYCDPADRASISRAVEMAWEAPRSGGLRAKLYGLTWEGAAIQTIRAYERVLGSEITAVDTVVLGLPT